MIRTAFLVVAFFNACSSLKAFVPAAKLSSASLSHRFSYAADSRTVSPLSASSSNNENKMGSIGYRLKQFIVDAIAGNDYDATQVNNDIDDFVKENPIAMFSFTTCPFCIKAKAALDDRGIKYAVRELDAEAKRGNAIRAELGRRYRRTSVPAIFVNGKFIGGCNDGPGLLPLLAKGEFDRLLASSGR
jgi:glutaredoxin 3